MAIRKYKPTTPGRRGSSVADFVEITRTTPEKSLTKPLPKKGGRNNQGRITARIALLHYADGEKRYIIAPKDLRQGIVVESGPNADIKTGNNLPLRHIP